MNSNINILKFIKSNRDWLLIILGLALVVFSAINLWEFFFPPSIDDIIGDSAVDQAGFAPILVPEGGIGDGGGSLDDPPVIPQRILIPVIDLDAPVVTSESVDVEVEKEDVTQFLVPEEYAVGWHAGSASLGVPGNTVLSGHHNAFGEVFGQLVDVKVGDEVILIGDGERFDYLVANKMILPEKDEPLAVRLENARWMMRSNDERVTLITCWPERSNTHRLILVAVPTEKVSKPALTATTAQTSTSGVIPVTGLQTQTPRPPEITVANTGTFSVNIRERPDLNSDIIGSLESGDEAVGIARSEDSSWVFIRYGDVEGWVSLDVVDISSPTDTLPVESF